MRKGFCLIVFTGFLAGQGHAQTFEDAPNSCDRFLQSRAVETILNQATAYYINDGASFQRELGRADLAYGVGTGCGLPSLTVQVGSCDAVIRQWRNLDRQGVVHASQLSTPPWTAWEDQRSGYTFSLYRGPDMCAASVIGGKLPRQ